MSTIINHENIVWLARGSFKSSEEKVFKQGKYYEPAFFERNHKLFGFTALILLKNSRNKRKKNSCYCLTLDSTSYAN